MRPFERLRHRHPFVMLDSAEVIEEGVCAQGARHITANDPAVSPEGVFPAVYIIEAMAQTSGVASGRKTSSMLAGMKNMEFSGPVITGDTLETESVFERSFGGLYYFNCRASVSGQTIAKGGIILYFDDTA